MSLAIIIPDRDISSLLAELRRQGPDLDIQCWPTLPVPEAIKVALAWSVTDQMFTGLTNLAGVIAFGAGVDRLLEINALRDVPLARIVDPHLALSMSQYVVAHVLRHHLKLGDLMMQQQGRVWAPNSVLSKSNVVVLGAGQIGSAVSNALKQLGFDVLCWARELRSDTDTVISGEVGLRCALNHADFVINTLPLTSATQGILDYQFFSDCRRGCYLVNVGRGAHLVEEDLLVALDNGQLSGATLDVFIEEPLPQHHAFWQHKDIVVTPHCAALTDQRSAVAQVIDSYRRVSLGLPMLHLVDRQRGY